MAHDQDHHRRLVEDDVAGLLGWRPQSWTRVHGGYTPAARYVVRDGARSAFVKIATNPVTRAHMRGEIAAYGAIDGPFRPRFYGACDDADHPFLVIEDLSQAVWPPPWSAGRVDAVLRSLAELNATAAPLRPFARSEGDLAPGWAAVAADPAPFLALGLASEAWLVGALPTLIAAEAACVTAGDAPCHFDLRSDNICFVGERAVLIDWGSACLSNPKLDLGAWLPSLAYEGGPLPDDILPNEPEIAAWICGYFAARAGLPAIPDAPFVRRVQREQLSTSLPWACRALGLDAPTGR